MPSKSLSKKQKLALKEPEAPKIVRTSEWQGFTPGTPVIVSAGHLGGKNSYSWTFVCHALNTETGSEWVEVFGGNKSHEGYRAFKPEQVKILYIEPKIKECCRCGRIGSKLFVRQDTLNWRCKNYNACAMREIEKNAKHSI